MYLLCQQAESEVETSRQNQSKHDAKPVETSRQNQSKHHAKTKNVNTWKSYRGLHAFRDMALKTRTVRFWNMGQDDMCVAECRLVSSPISK
jgi:hypothetical protein